MQYSADTREELLYYPILLTEMGEIKKAEIYYPILKADLFAQQSGDISEISKRPIRASKEKMAEPSKKSVPAEIMEMVAGFMMRLRQEQIHYEEGIGEPLAEMFLRVTNHDVLSEPEKREHFLGEVFLQAQFQLMLKGADGEREFSKGDILRLESELSGGKERSPKEVLKNEETAVPKAQEVKDAAATAVPKAQEVKDAAATAVPKAQEVKDTSSPAYPTLWDALQASGKYPTKKVGKTKVADMGYIQEVETDLPKGERIQYAIYCETGFVGKSRCKVLPNGMIKPGFGEELYRLLVITDHFICIDYATPTPRKLLVLPKKGISRIKGIYDKKLLTVGQIRGDIDINGEYFYLWIDNVVGIPPEKQYQDYLAMIQKVIGVEDMPSNELSLEARVARNKKHMTEFRNGILDPSFYGGDRYGMIDRYVIVAVIDFGVECFDKMESALRQGDDPEFAKQALWEVALNQTLNEMLGNPEFTEEWSEFIPLTEKQIQDYLNSIKDLFRQVIVDARKHYENEFKNMVDAYGGNSSKVDTAPIKDYQAQNMQQKGQEGENGEAAVEEACLLEKVSLQTTIDRFNALVGQNGMKTNIFQLLQYADTFARANDKEKKKMKKENYVPMVLTFVGGHGTGKTTVGKMLTQAYVATGVLQTGNYCEIDASKLPCNNYASLYDGLTELLKKNAGGTVMINQVSELAGKNRLDTFAGAVFNAVINRLTRDTLLIISDTTAELLNNQADNIQFIKRNLTWFQPFSVEELYEIYESFMNRVCTTQEDAKELILELFEELHADPGFTGGNFVQALSLLLFENRNERVLRIPETQVSETDMQIKAQDLTAVLESLSDEA